MEVMLRVIEGPHEGREYVFDRHDTFVVGRWSQAHFPVPEDGFLSREHFLIEFNPPLCFLRDLGSTNGTKVNGVRVDTARLHDGDVISAGTSAFSVHVRQTWSEIPRVNCRSCGCDAPDDVVLAARPGEGSIDWICEPCASSSAGGIRCRPRDTGSSSGSAAAAWARSSAPASSPPAGSSPSR